MDNSYSSYADSGDSSPRSREIDCENQSWDEQPSNYRVKLLCSYGGKIQPRPHDNQLAYVGGETKILAVDRNTKFLGIISKLSAIHDSDVTLKYQLPGEDLDALVSVTNDEDLEHMMLEYDRLHRASSKPARLRLFLFPLKTSNPSSFTGKDPKNNQQWFVDALNSAQIQQSIDSSSPPASETPSNPDFLFGLDKGISPTSPASSKLQDPTPELTIQEQIPVGSDSSREEHRILVGEHADIQRQIHDLQRLQIANQEQQQTVLQRNSDETLTRAFPGDHYAQKIPENIVPTGSPVTVPVNQVLPPPTVSVPAAYWQERHITPPVSGTDHQVYLIPAPPGYYQQPQTVRQVPGQGYYAMPPRDVYREQPVYSVPPPQQTQQRMVAAAGYGEGVGMIRPSVGGGVTMTDGSFAQVAYDGSGRQIYYTATPCGVIPNPSLGAMDLRQVGHQQQQQQPNLISIPEVKIQNPKPSQASV